MTRRLRVPRAIKALLIALVLIVAIGYLYLLYLGRSTVPVLYNCAVPSPPAEYCYSPSPQP